MITEHLCYMPKNFIKKEVAFIIYKMNKKGKILFRYESVSEAAKDNKIKEKQIQKCLDNLINTAGGFKWKQRKYLRNVI